MPDIIHKNFTGAEAVHPAAYVQSSDPGTVGANKFWIDTTTGPPYVLNLRNPTNTAWVQFGATGLTGGAGPAGSQGPPGTNAAPYVCVQDQRASGTAAGTFTQGAWQTRTLNAVIANDSNLATLDLSTSRITLPAGTYRCFVRCPAYFVAHHQARLRNISMNATALVGSAAKAQSASNSMTDSFIAGRFGISSACVFEVQHQCQTTSNTNGFGEAGSFGEVEVYTVAQFWLEGLPPPFLGSTGFSENPSFDRIYRQRRAAL